MRHVTIQETLAGGNTSSYMTGDRIIGTLDLMNPDQHTIHEHMLDVGHGHTLYVHDWGNKAAKMPIFFLHGGPGGQCKDKHKLPFDPHTQRVVFHDQRGSGRSVPYGRWHHNTTQELAADITKVADHLGIDRFMVTGGSWGSLLALYYGLQEPRRVAALVVDGVWTGSRAENDWLDQGLFRTHFPDVWARYLAETPAAHHADPTAYHFAQVLGKDTAAAAESARVYGNLEGSIVALNDQAIAPTQAVSPDFDPIPAQIEMRYLAKHCFLSDRYIIENAHKLPMPVYLLQGRYDFVCPPVTAYTLAQSIPNAHLTWLLAGHMAEHETITVKRLIFKHLTEDNQ
jgi:proline iminopeptidase